MGREIKYDRHPSIRKEISDRHALVIGQVVMASVALSDAFYLIYLEIVAKGDMQHLGNDWKLARSDGAQRKILENAINKLPAGQRNAIHWAILAAKTLATARDALVHGFMIHTSDEHGSTVLAPDFVSNRQELYLILRERSKPEDWTVVIGDYNVLFQYIREIYTCMVFDTDEDWTPIEWPARPELLSI